MACDTDRITGLDNLYRIVGVVRPDALDRLKGVMSDVWSCRHVRPDASSTRWADPYDPTTPVAEIITNGFSWPMVHPGVNYWTRVAGEVIQYLHDWYGEPVEEYDWVLATLQLPYPPIENTRIVGVFDD